MNVGSAASAHAARRSAHARLTVQRPDWPQRELADVISELASRPPLVRISECDRLRRRLGAVARGQAFMLQGGDCAETFDGLSADRVYAQLTTLFRMADILTDAFGMPVVKVGRIAGQYAKPRSKPTEVRDGVELPVYRGDAVNGRQFTPAARVPEPARLRLAYEVSARTLRLIRSFCASSGAHPHAIHRNNWEFLTRSPFADRGELGSHHVSEPGTRGCFEFYTSHEALLLDYEEALARADRSTGRSYGLSGHLLWIGERTRHLDGAHVRFAASVSNPLAVKLGPSATPDDVLALMDRLDPDREAGRLSFITRMGADRIRDLLPPLVTKTAAAGAAVAWICDPMHGNTFMASSGHKTRHFDDVLDEIKGFFEVHRTLGSHPGGIHLEMTGDNVTECLGGGSLFGQHDLDLRYESACDPRLNCHQSLSLSYELAVMARGG